MKKLIGTLIGPLALSIILGTAAHFAIVHYAPNFIMDRAYTMLGERGTPVHGFNMAPQMTAETQSVVRPSPDLAYSACRFDMNAAPGGVRVRMGAYDGYSSLSFFDAQTNNFRTIRGNGAAQETVLFPPDFTLPTGSKGVAIPYPNMTRAPSAKGIILIRRLAPSADDFAAAALASAGDLCEAI